MSTQTIAAGQRMPATEWSPARYRASRHKQEASKRRATILLLLAADARVQYRGIDYAVAALAANLGFERFDLTAIRVKSERRTITLLVVPRRVWHSKDGFNALLLLKRQAANRSIRCVLLPEPVLHRQPRLKNSMLVSAANNVPLTTDQRMRLVSHLCGNEGSVPLEEFAAVISDHQDPMSAILALVSIGIVTVPLNKALNGRTPVSKGPSLLSGEPT